MLLVRVRNLKKSFGDKEVLNVEKLDIYEGEKVGLVGENGSGKSTLINILIGKLQADEGEALVNKSYGYINQFEESVELSKSKISSELGITYDYNQWLSGGEKVKLRLSNALSKNSKILIADEPTSNLDIETIQYLDDRFKKYSGAILLVAHDRALLDSVCNRIIEIDNGKLLEYKGNYSDYLDQKAQRLNRERFEYEEYIKEKSRLEEAAKVKSSLRDGIRKTPKRFGNSEARLHKMGDQSSKKSMENSIKNIQSRISKLEVKNKPIEEQKIKIDISKGNEFYSNYPLEMKNLNLIAGDKTLILEGNYKLKKNKKVALIGGNGVGKTTLIRAILNNNEEIKIANRVKIGYFSQNLDILNSDKSILENIKEVSSLDDTLIRITLARFLFKGEEVDKQVNILSGGERVRVALCKIILGDNNLLILDEPTNYLDIKSMEALEEALIATNKTLLIVSHDSEFINKVCNETIVIEDKKLFSYAVKLDRVKEAKEKKNINKVEKLKKEREMVLRNKLTELISLLSIESNEKKKEELEIEYNKILETIKSI